MLRVLGVGIIVQVPVPVQVPATTTSRTTTVPMMPSAVVVFIESLLLILQFDGSLRPPRDRGFPTQKLGRLASCSAIVLSNDRRRVLAIGGQTFPLVAGMTSADAEFEGLLLGLEFLCHTRHPLDSNDSIASPSLLVEGDCKAVIDIMNRDARARKVASRYDVAMRYITELDPVSVEFRHIPRDMNQLGDSICREVIQFAIDQNVDELKALLESQAITVSDAVQKYFDERSIIPFSDRISVYDILWKHARQSGDGAGLDHLGKVIERDAKLWPTTTGQTPCKLSLTSLAIRIQLEGHDLLGTRREAGTLRQRHRFVLEKYPMESQVKVGSLDASVRQKQTEGVTSPFMSWKQHAREVFLNGGSMRMAKRKVWTTAT